MKLTKTDHVIKKTQELFAARDHVAQIERELGELIGDELAGVPMHQAAPRHDRTLVAGAGGMFADIARPGAPETVDISERAGLVPSDGAPAAQPARRGSAITPGLTQRVLEAVVKLAGPIRARDVVDELNMGTNEMKYVSAALSHLTGMKKIVKIDQGLFESLESHGKKRRPAGKKAKTAKRKK